MEQQSIKVLIIDILISKKLISLEGVNWEEYEAVKAELKTYDLTNKEYEYAIETLTNLLGL